MIFNGEIYNYIELKKQYLDSQDLPSTGDSRVLIELISKLGFTNTLALSNGMWAIALDHKENKLSLSRDRFGEKPLYYCMNGKQLIFSSELKSLLSLSEQNYKLNPRTIAVLLVNHLWTMI